MEIRQLEYLVAVAEEANFTRAAARVHISQSGVSAQIRQLERDLGATLIDRSGRTATVTPAGAAALEHARAAIDAVRSVRRAVDDVTGVVRGRLEVGMVTGCMVTPLFDALASFHAAHPLVEISLVEDNSDQLIDRVRTGVTDLALVGVAGAPPAGLDALTIVSERLIAAVPAGHPLAARPAVTLAEAAGFPIVSLPVGTGIRTAFDDGCAARGVVADIALQASAPDAVADLARRGLGVAILSASMVEPGDERLVPLVLEDADVPALLALVWRQLPGGPALDRLVEHARRAFAGPPAD